MQSNTKSAYKIAQELGITPQAVYKRLTLELLNRLDNHITYTENGKMRFDEVAERAIKGIFEPVEQPVQQPKPKLNNHVDELIAMLKNELEEKNQQIAEQNRHIAELVTAINTAQALHAGTMQQRLTDNAADDTALQPPPGLLSRIFGRHKAKSK